MTANAPVLLAVEDEPRNAALLQAILSRAGYLLHVAGDLAQARNWLADSSPALVLLDRHLPDGDGLDLIGTIRELRAAQVRADPPGQRERPATRPGGGHRRRLRRLPGQARPRETVGCSRSSPLPRGLARHSR